MRVRKIRARADFVDVTVTGARALRASTGVVAVGPEAVVSFVEKPRPATKGLQTWWFAADAAPTASIQGALVSGERVAHAALAGD